MSENRITVDGEALVKAVAKSLTSESVFLSPEPATFIANPRGILKLVEDAGATPQQIDQWIEEARTRGESSETN